MPRPTIKIDPVLLKRIIGQVEANGPLENRSRLFEAVASKYNEESVVKIKPHNIYSRVDDWGIILKTPLGKPGRPAAGFTSTSSIAHKPESASEATLTTAIRKKCLDCCDSNKEEITNCGIVSCPLWTFRPYQLQQVRNDSSSLSTDTSNSDTSIP